MKSRRTHDLIRDSAPRTSSEMEMDPFRERPFCSENAHGTEAELLDLWIRASTKTDVPLADADKVLRMARMMERKHTRIRRRKGLLQGAAILAVMLAASLSLVFLRPPMTILASSENGKSSYTLPDGSKVWLNKESQVRYRGRLRGKCRIVEINGEAFFDVEKDARHPFVVKTKDMAITVLGTRFTVTAYPGHPGSAYLEEGSIKVKGKGFQETFLSPGQGISYSDRTKQWTKNLVKPENHTSWIKSELIFTNAPLGDILENLEHWYRVSIVCTDRELLRTDRLSMKVREEPIEEILDAISSLSGLEYVRNGNVIVLTH